MWVGQVLGRGLRFLQRFFANTVGVPKLLRHEEPLGCDAQAGMVVEAAPASALVVSKPEVLLGVLVVTFDALVATRASSAARTPASGALLERLPDHPSAGVGGRAKLGVDFSREF